MISTLEQKEVTINALDIPARTLFRPFGAESEIIYFRTEVGAICIYRDDDDDNGQLGYYATEEQLKSARLNRCTICGPEDSVTISNSPVRG